MARNTRRSTQFDSSKDKTNVPANGNATETANTENINKTLTSIQTKTDGIKASGITDSPLFTGSSFSGDTPLTDILSAENINAQNMDADSLMNINNNVDNDNINLDLDMDLGIMHNNTPTPIQSNVHNSNPNIVTEPIVVSPSQSSASSNQPPYLTPLKPDAHTPLPDDMLKSGNTPDTYTLSNYYNNNKHPKIVNLDDAGNPLDDPDEILKGNLLDSLDKQNSDFSKDLSLAASRAPALSIKNAMLPPETRVQNTADKDTKSLTAFKKPSKKKIASSAPNKRPAFVVKLWKMINDPANNKYISWMPSGKAIQVQDREHFMKFVLPKFFKHNNFASFVRQLNMYGWHKIQDVSAGSLAQTDEVWQFENPNFIKDREDLLDNIVRNKPGSNDEEEYDIKYLLEQLEQMKHNQLLISDDLRRVRHDNELLWKENYIARERHKIQSDTLDKIMRFLANIYGNNTSKLIEQMNSNGELVEIHNPNDPNQNSGFYNGNTAMGRNMAPGYNVDPRSQMGPNMSQYNQVAIHNDHYGNYQKYNGNHYGDNNGGFREPHYTNNNSGNAQSRVYYSGAPSPYAQAGNDGTANARRRRLMITNKSNSSSTIYPNNHPGSISSVSSVHTPSSNGTVKSSNELRMNNLNYETSNAVDSNDSSIQEIHRGPENRNADSYRSYIQEIPDFINNPRSFIEPDQQRFQDGRPLNFNSPSQITQQQQQLEQHSRPHIIHQPLGRMDPSRPTQIQQPRMESPTIIPQTPLNDIMNGEHPHDRRVDSNPTQLMGNIQQKLHKNQGALKQVNDWLNKYSDDLDSEEMPLPDDFKVDDFLQQPLDLSVSGTPIDFSNVDEFTNGQLPPTPVIVKSPLNMPITTSRNGQGPAPTVDTENPLKRNFTQVYDDDGNGIAENYGSEKRFRSGEFGI